MSEAWEHELLQLLPPAKKEAEALQDQIAFRQLLGEVLRSEKSILELLPKANLGSGQGRYEAAKLQGKIEGLRLAFVILSGQLEE